MEESQPVDQFDTLRAQILARRAIFARQGCVVATWRTRGGVRFGPYYQLAYREEGRQRAIYLGRSAELADQVRALLAEMQQPRHHRDRLRRLIAQARAALRRQYAELNRELAAVGYCLRGREIRPLRPALDRAMAGEKAENLGVVDQQNRSGQAAVGKTRGQGSGVGRQGRVGASPVEQKCRSGQRIVTCKSEQKCGPTPHPPLTASPCRASSCLARQSSLTPDPFRVVRVFRGSLRGSARASPSQLKTEN